MSSTVSGSLALSGVYTGIDSDALVQSAMQLEQRKIQLLETDKAEYNAKSQILDQIQNRLESLRSLVDSMRNAKDLRSTSASSSDKTIVGVSAGSGAVEGSHSVEVNQLASAEKEVHDGVVSKEDPLDVVAATFEYTYNGVTRTINTTDETSLETLVELINNDAENPGVSASILEHDGKYHLVLSGDDSGSDYAITIEAATTLAGFAPGTFVETKTAQDCQVRVDGYPAVGWIERSSNTLTDVIPGVTLTLYNTTAAGEEVTVNLSRDTSAVKSKIQSLVDEYNGIMAMVDEVTGYDEETGESGLMQGDTILSMVTSQVRSGLLGEMRGFEDVTDPYTLVGQLGLEFDKDGVLTLDEDTLDDALSEDYYGVLDLIGAQATGVSSDETYIQFYSAHEDTQAGEYEVEVTFDNGTITAARFRRVDTDTPGDWEDMTIDGNLLTAPTDSEGKYLQLTASSSDAGVATQTTNVRVKQGFAGSMFESLEAILDSSEGALKLKQDQYDRAMKDLDTRIEAQERRLEDKEERLRQKYARMEAALAKLDQYRAQVDAMVQSLSQMKSSGSSSKS
jgi:flagellar hook-associated protein 2